MRENWVEIYEHDDITIEVNESKTLFRLSCFKNYHFVEERIVDARELIDFILDER